MADIALVSTVLVQRAGHDLVGSFRLLMKNFSITARQHRTAGISDKRRFSVGPLRNWESEFLQMSAYVMLPRCCSSEARQIAILMILTGRR